MLNTIQTIYIICSVRIVIREASGFGINPITCIKSLKQLALWQFISKAIDKQDNIYYSIIMVNLIRLYLKTV